MIIWVYLFCTRFVWSLLRTIKVAVTYDTYPHQTFPVPPIPESSGVGLCWRTIKSINVVIMLFKYPKQPELLHKLLLSWNSETTCVIFWFRVKNCVYGLSCIFQSSWWWARLYLLVSIRPTIPVINLFIFSVLCVFQLYYHNQYSQKPVYHTERLYWMHAVFLLPAM